MAYTYSPYPTVVRRGARHAAAEKKGTDPALTGSPAWLGRLMGVEGLEGFLKSVIINVLHLP